MKRVKTMVNVNYKRGTVVRSGKLYGFYPDGSLYRIYDHQQPSFFEIHAGVLRVRQATEQGYAVVMPWSIFDGSYPTSQLRRARVQGDGTLTPAITASSNGLLIYEGVEDE